MGGSSSGKGGGSSWINWISNPLGTAGKEWLGVQLDPVSDMVASATQSAFSSKYRKEHGGFSLGNSFIADTFNPMLGGQTEEMVNRSKDPAWQEYYKAAGTDNWGEAKKAEPAPEKTETKDAAALARARRAPTKNTSLLGEDE